MAVPAAQRWELTNPRSVARAGLASPIRTGPGRVSPAPRGFKADPRPGFGFSFANGVFLRVRRERASPVLVPRASPAWQLRGVPLQRLVLVARVLPRPSPRSGSLKSQDVPGARGLAAHHPPAGAFAFKRARDPHQILLRLEVHPEPLGVVDDFWSRAPGRGTRRVSLGTRSRGG